MAQALLGHSDLETTLGVYTHAIPDAQRRAVELANHSACFRQLFPPVVNWETERISASVNALRRTNLRVEFR